MKNGVLCKGLWSLSGYVDTDIELVLKTSSAVMCDEESYSNPKRKIVKGLIWIDRYSTQQGIAEST